MRTLFTTVNMVKPVGLEGKNSKFLAQFDKNEGGGEGFMRCLEDAHTAGLNLVNHLVASKEARFGYLVNLGEGGIVGDLEDFAEKVRMVGVPFARMINCDGKMRAETEAKIDEQMAIDGMSQEKATALVIAEMIKEQGEGEWSEAELNILYQQCEDICGDALARIVGPLRMAREEGIDIFGETYHQQLRAVVMRLNKLLRGMYAVSIMQKFLAVKKD